MLRPQPKRRQKCRTSKHFCEEKLSCPDPISEAAYYCRDCNSHQCQNCERDIHSRKLSFEFHDRRIIEPPSPTCLCQSHNLGLDCKNRNFADVWCENCRVVFCFDCFNEYHKNRKQHVSISFAHYEKRERERVFAEEAFATTHEGLSIKQTSPLSPNDDTLTFCSFPQGAQQLQTQVHDFESARMSFSRNSSVHSNGSNHSMPDLCPDADLRQLTTELAEAGMDDSLYDETTGTSTTNPLLTRSFLLVNDKEELQVRDETEFTERLGCPKDSSVKVLSIFGNTGDGKSHTLNHTFFHGQEVFKTSAFQDSCTVGVWASYDDSNSVIIIDTEGLLGSSSNDNRRTRLLLKVLATSDIVVFRTRAERLHNDMFVFLSNASKAYKKHFSEELRTASQRYRIKESNLGPTLVVFQETTHTEPLKGEQNRRADAVLRDLFAKHNYPVDAFNEVCYVGTKTVKPPTDFTAFRNFVLARLRDNSIRASRNPSVMFQSLKALNEKFNGEIERVQLNTFPEKYFTCVATCLACGAKCMKTMNHDTEVESHDAGRDAHCQYKCALAGRKNIVVPKTSESSDSSWMGLTKYLWSGYVLECSACGVIYRSRERWFGNLDPESQVLVEVRHIWPQGNRALQGTHNAARKVLDSFHYMRDTISSISAKPTKMLAEWTADQIAPAYWVPNSQIIKCRHCELVFTSNEQKHHCRACGQGFCDECSTKSRPVPERGWGEEPVRVCDACFAGNSAGHEARPGEEPVTARKVGEAVSSTLGVLASALDYPMGMLKDSARPEYWVPDEQIKTCIICEEEFTLKRPIHHCRACGQGVCDECSQGRRPVPLRGWDYPVRVCSKCEKKRDEM
ncbi:hypothetical protein BaRGS_00003219 [Batillaria attramentaria]|uniref:Zinc finger FYVE domain-containing protein 1 n=1 Tax=Batillaria attramentaria TaxID=370345 RepID=A0ABD0M0N0_9CAEN